MGAHAIILIKSNTLLSMGAEPVVIILTLPPMTAAIFLNMIGSHNPLLYTLFCKLAVLDAIPLSAKHLLHPFNDLTLSYTFP